MNYQKKLKAISTKELIKNLIDKFSILNGAKYFSLGVFQSYLVFMPAKYFSGTTRIELWEFNVRKNYWEYDYIRQQFCTSFCRSSFIIWHEF